MTNRTDNFNRADSASALSTPSDAGSAWVTYSGTWGISSNQAYEPAGALLVAAALEASVADADVQATIAVVADGEGVVARLADDSNYLMMRYSGVAGGIQMFKKVAGSFTQLGSNAAFTHANGDVHKLSVSGSTLNAYVNGSLKVGPITDSAGSTNTKHGLFDSGNSTLRWDDFSITGTGGAAAANDDERHFPRGVHRGVHRGIAA